MSYDKVKKQQRYSNDKRIQKKRLTIWNLYNFTNTPVSDKRKGMMVKFHPLSCGRGRCHMCCNPRRLFGYVTIAEHKADMRFKDMLKDICVDEYDGIPGEEYEGL